MAYLYRLMVVLSGRSFHRVFLANSMLRYALMSYIASMQWGDALSHPGFRLAHVLLSAGGAD